MAQEHRDDAGLAGIRVSSTTFPNPLHQWLPFIRRAVARELRRRALRLGRDPRQDIDDVTHEVVVYLLRNGAAELRRLDPLREASSASFIELVAQRRVRRILEVQRGNPWQHTMSGDFFDEATHSTADPTKRLDAAMDLARIAARIKRQCSARDARIFVALFLGASTVSEVCLQEGISTDALYGVAAKIRKLAKAPET